MNNAPPGFLYGWLWPFLCAVWCRDSTRSVNIQDLEWRVFYSAIPLGPKLHRYPTHNTFHTFTNEGLPPLPPTQRLDCLVIVNNLFNFRWHLFQIISRFIGLFFWIVGLLRFLYFEVLEFWDFDILKFWIFDILELWDFGTLRFWNFENGDPGWLHRFCWLTTFIDHIDRLHW